jgi:hypothetical protein
MKTMEISSIFALTDSMFCIDLTPNYSREDLTQDLKTFSNRFIGHNQEEKLRMNQWHSVLPDFHLIKIK